MSFEDAVVHLPALASEDASNANYKTPVTNHLKRNYNEDLQQAKYWVYKEDTHNNSTFRPEDCLQLKQNWEGIKVFENGLKTRCCLPAFCSARRIPQAMRYWSFFTCHPSSVKCISSQCYTEFTPGFCQTAMQLMVTCVQDINKRPIW